MAHTNPILDTRMHQGDFAGARVIKLTPNVISESIYAQCGAYGNEYLLLDAIVDCCKDIKRIYLLEQKTSIQGRPITLKTTIGCKIYCQ